MRTSPCARTSCARCSTWPAAGPVCIPCRSPSSDQELDVKAVSPSSVTLEVVRLDARRVPVSVRYGGDPRGTVVVDNARVTPPTVLIRGATSELARIVSARVDVPFPAQPQAVDAMQRAVPVTARGDEVSGVLPCAQPRTCARALRRRRPRKLEECDDRPFRHRRDPRESPTPISPRNSRSPSDAPAPPFSPAHRDGRPIVIGRDTRLSGTMLEAALVAGITSVGRDALLRGGRCRRPRSPSITRPRAPPRAS